MEDNQRPFTPMIDQDPPTPEPVETIRKGATTRTGTRSSSSNAPPTDAGTNRESPTTPASTRAKDKASKDTGKSAAKTKGTRSSIKSTTAAETIADDKDGDNEQNVFLETSAYPDTVRDRSESSTRAPPSVMADIGYVPFTIEPEAGSIAIGASQIFKIKFAPLDVNDYQARLTCW